MGWLGNFELDRENDMLWQRHKLSNGQFCMIGFERNINDCGDVEDYNVVFAVADKKKQLKGFFECSKDNTITLESTGKCGIEALIWAKDKILEFEEEMKGYEGDNITISIMVAGEDNHRFRLYERGLKRYGYKKVPGSGSGDWPWYMKKTILNKGNIVAV